MGVQFYIRNVEPDYEKGTGFVDVHNGNGRAMFRLMGIPSDDEQPYGEMAAPVLKLLAEGALMAGADSEQKPARNYRGWGGCRVIDGGIDPDKVERRLRDLVKLCELAGPAGVITWG